MTSTVTSGGELGVRSHWPCLKILSGSTVVNFNPKTAQSGLFFQTYSIFRDLCRSIRVDLITLGVNDHHGHLEGSLGYPRPLTLPQNSTGCLRGDVRTDLCQSSLLSAPVGSVKAIWVCARPKQPKPDPTKV
ncbi:hypothetical protein CRG98_006537 [Punica granatum]|uniref:Uncharacterized protein n=1 Tax=Punica granatum TaxID=22663 RepID=A0A2I0KX39_PUNGR|nr:hypothetical protein CRG98_006537 [Punica granatum]